MQFKQPQTDYLYENHSEKLKRISVYKIADQIHINEILDMKEVKKNCFFIQKVLLGICMKSKKVKAKTFQCLTSFYKIYQIDNNSYINYKHLQYLFIFHEGTIVFWNFTNQEEIQIINYLFYFINQRVHRIHDEFDYLERQQIEKDNNVFVKNFIENNIVFLESSNYEEKVIFSLLFFHYTELSYIEDLLDKIIDDIDSESNFQIQKMLNNFDQTVHMKHLGQIYYIRAQIRSEAKNFNQILSERISDEFWPQYKQCKSYLKCDDRILKRQRYNTIKISILKRFFVIIIS